MTTQDIYTDVVSNWVNQRLNALSYGIEQERDDDPLPFMLSKSFAKRFDQVLRQLVIPEMIRRSSGLMNRMENIDPKEQKKYLDDIYQINC